MESRLPELPDQMLARFIEQYGLSEYDAGVLVADRDLAVFYEEVAAPPGVDPKQAANWITVELRGRLNEAGVDICRSQGGTPERMADLIALVAAGTSPAPPPRTSSTALSRRAIRLPPSSSGRGSRQWARTSSAGWWTR